MEINIRSIRNDHAKEVIDLILNIQQNEFNIPITLNDQPDLLQIQQSYYDNGGCFWAAFVGEELVGTIALIKYDSNAGAIRKMFVKKEFRGKELRIAQKLFETLILFAKTNKMNELYLGTVDRLQAAIRFYERNNFIRVEKANLPKNFPLMAADNVFYGLRLDTTS